MRSLFALVRKDLKGYFDQPIGYILIVIFVALVSYWFFRDAFLIREASLRALFTTDFTIDRPSLPWLLVLVVPAATMRLVAEEQRDGTLEILLTQPIRGWIVLLAKFLSGLVFVLVFILATLGIPIALETAGNLDEGAVIAQYVGTFFLAASFVSIGLFTSSLTRNQIVALILGFILIGVLMLAGLDVVADTLPDRVSGLIRDLSPVTHFSSIARGVIDLRDVLYFVALVSTFLSATYLTILGKSLSHLSPQYRNLQLGVAGLIVLSLLVGWFSSSIPGRLDLTEDKLFTLSAGTASIVSGLDDLLTVRLFASKDPPVDNSRDPPLDLALVTRDVNDFLDDFAARSKGNVKLVRKFPDPEGDDDEREAAQAAQLAGIPPRQFSTRGQSEFGVKLAYLGLDMTYADRRERISFISSVDGFEYRLATLANKMSKRDRKTVAFLTGHGEKSIDRDLTILAGLLSQQYEVTVVGGAEDTPLDLSDVDVLVIPGPTQEVPETDREALNRYLENGGKAMILLDPVVVDTSRGMLALPNANSFTDFLEPYGILVEDDLVFDLGSNVALPFTTQSGTVRLSYPYWMRVLVADSKVAGDIGTVVLPWASSIGIAEGAGERVEVTPLLQTTELAGIDFEYGDVGPEAPTLREATPDNLFQSLVGVTVTGPDAGQGPFRLVVVGDSDWLSDGVVGRSEENLAVGLNLTDWLAQEATLASIRSKVISNRRLDVTSSTHENVMQYANILGVPLAFVLIGLLRYLRRRSIGQGVYRREE